MTLSWLAGSGEGAMASIVKPAKQGPVVPLLRNSLALLRRGQKALAPPSLPPSRFRHRQGPQAPPMPQEQAPAQMPVQGPAQPPQVQVTIQAPPPEEDEKDVPWQEGRETVPAPETDQDRARQDMAIEAKARLVGAIIDKMFSPVLLLEYQQIYVGQSGEG